MKHKGVSLMTLILMTLFGLGCSTGEKTTVKVHQLDSLEQKKVNKGLIYGLPESRLSFDIKVIRERRVPGPYHQYGEKLLGLSGIPHEKTVDWQIAGVSIHQSPRIDYQQLYLAQPRGKVRLDWEKFSRQGWIIPFDQQKRQPEKTYFYPAPQPEQEVLFKDLSVKKFVGKETRTVYEKVWRDSLYASVPVEKTETIKKDLPEKAREAASFIFMIREKRFELISGMGDYYPEGNAMEAALNKMDQLEQDYLDLFEGRTFSDTLHYNVRLTPDDTHLQEPLILFRFSQQQGILKAEADKGDPVWLNIHLQENPRQVKKMASLNQRNHDSTLFYYRTPVASQLSLKYGERMIAEKYLDIYQYGPVLRMPLKFLNRSRFIDYPEYK